MHASHFGKAYKLRTPKQYANVFNKPERSVDSLLTVLARPNQLRHPRLGMAIAKKNLKHAVQRNRLKRLIREFFRLQVKNTTGGLDFVVMAKKNSADKNGEQIRQALQKHFNYLIKKYKNLSR